MLVHNNINETKQTQTKWMYTTMKTINEIINAIENENAWLDVQAKALSHAYDLICRKAL